MMATTKTHTTLGGSVANSGGGNAPFADLVSTSYGLALNDYTDDSRDGGVATSAASAANHAQNVLASHCGGNSEFSHHQEPYCENLDTFHAEFITQPIDYPIDATPPPPLSLSQAPPTLNLQNTVTTSSTPSLSPSGLPSFLDTYSPGQDRQERFFKQEPAATPPTPTFNAHPPSSSSYASHGYNQQQGFAFPKKEDTFSPTMSDFYQPNSFAQFAPNFSADTGGRGSIFEHQEEVTPSALTHALQGVVQGHSRILAKRTQYSAPCTETSGSSKSAQARMGPPAVPPPIRATPGSGSGSSKSSGRSTNAAKQPTALLCAVCGDNAACQHYGVRTCEGCKGFFKRTVQKNAKYVCLSNKDCPVDKRRRNRCQFCRFQKCLNVGMVKEVVRTDSLKGRRGRLPSKPRSPHDSPPSPPQTLISVLVRAHNDTTPDLHNLDYSQLVDWSSQDTKEGVINRRDEGVLLILNLIANSLETCRRFCDRIPGMAELIANDREILTKSAIFELLILKLAHLNKGSNENFIFCNGSVVTLDQVRYILGDWVDTILSLSHALYDMDIDLYAFACLCALTLVNDRPGLTDPRKVESLTNKVINSLKEHTTYHPQAKNKQNYFARTVEKLQTVQVLRQEGRQKLFYLILELRNMGHPVHIPPIVEEIASQVH